MSALAVYENPGTTMLKQLLRTKHPLAVNNEAGEIELRRTLDIAEKDAIEIYVDGPSIILKKYEPTCIFCNDAKNVINYKGKNICANCLKEMKQLV